jgi:hypothetical protein
MNALARAVGFRWYEKRRRGGFEMRFDWAEITGGLGVALALCMFEEGFSLHVRLGWPNIFIKLPFLRRWHHEPDEMMESWGFSWFWDNVHLNWGRHTKIVHLPWAWEWVRSSYLMPDGQTWAHELRSWRRHSHLGTKCDAKHFLPSTDLPQWTEKHPYRYVLRSSEVQEREATIRVHEMEWRWRWFTWLPLPRLVKRSIDVNFNDEVGERAGSWKGGCLGCGYDLYPDETPHEALRRMERDRKF